MSFLILKHFRRGRHGSKSERKRQELQELDRALDEVLAAPIHEVNPERVQELARDFTRLGGRELDL